MDERGAAPGVDGDKAQSPAIYVTGDAQKALIVAFDLGQQVPLAVLACGFQPEVFQHTGGEAERGIMIGARAEKRHGDVHQVGVALAILPVKVAVQHQPHAGQVFGLFKAVGNGAVNTPVIAVVNAFHAAVGAVGQQVRVAIIRRQLGAGDRGVGRAFEVGEVTVIIQ